MCADLVEVPAANLKRQVPVKGSQWAVNVICPHYENDSVISVTSVISVLCVDNVCIQPGEYSIAIL